MSASRVVGDFLLSFGDDVPFPPQRDPQTIETWRHLDSRTRLRCCGDHLQNAQNERWQVWLLGEARLLEASEKPTDAQTLAQRLLEGRFDPNHLTGHFLLIARALPSRHWHVWTDRFATLHAYHTPAALGTFSPAVYALAPRRALDWVGLAGFLRNGFFPGDRTYDEAVRILPPATCSRLDEDGNLIQQQRYWQWHYQPHSARSFEATVEEFASLFHTLINALVSERRVALPISGGLDSRSTVAALPPGANYWAYSYGYTKDSTETAIARQIAAARGLTFEAFTIRPYLFDQLRDITAAVEGFQDVTQCRQAAVTGEIAARTRWLMAAHWGDVWFDQMGADAHTATGDLALKKFAKPGSAWLHANILQPHAPFALSQAEELIRAQSNDYAQIDDPDFRLKALKTDTWSFRWTTASLRSYHPGAFPLLPFYDTRIADFFCTVPSHYLQGRALQIAYLKRFAPDLARIKWQAYDANLYQYPYFNTFRLPLRVFKKLRRLLLGQSVIQRNWEVQFYAPDARAQLETWLLAPGRKLHQWIDPKTLQSLIAKLYQPPVERETGSNIAMLLTLSAWLEQYGG